MKYAPRKYSRSLEKQSEDIHPSAFPPSSNIMFYCGDFPPVKDSENCLLGFSFFFAIEFPRRVRPFFGSLETLTAKWKRNPILHIPLSFTYPSAYYTNAQACRKYRDRSVELALHRKNVISTSGSVHEQGERKIMEAIASLIAD